MNFLESKSRQENQRKYFISENLLYFFKKWAISGLFFSIFVFSVQLTVNKINVRYKSLTMTWLELWTSVVGSDCSANWATTTAQNTLMFNLLFLSFFHFHSFLSFSLSLFDCTFRHYLMFRNKLSWQSQFAWRRFLRTYIWMFNKICRVRKMTFASKVQNNLFSLGREPWSSGYGRRLMIWSSWFRIPATYTGWRFLTLNNLLCLFVEKTIINKKRPGMAHLKNLFSF